LISNAVKFSPEGNAVRLGCDCDAERVRRYVEDHGPASRRIRCDRIFQRFGQASSQEQSRMPGSGLGLSICRARASRVGGDIGHRTELGKGGVFWVDLTGAKGEAAQMTAA
jgi:signal transduction histidine kinase